MSELYHVVMDNNYLAHHGIKGQKWGVKNGPPYPLHGRPNAKIDYRSDRTKKLQDKYSKTGSEIHRKALSKSLKRDFDDAVGRNHMHADLKARRGFGLNTVKSKNGKMDIDDYKDKYISVLKTTYGPDPQTGLYDWAEQTFKDHMILNKWINTVSSLYEHHGFGEDENKKS